MSRYSKTGRKYGRIYKRILRYAARHKKPFHITVFVPPLTKKQASLNCLHLFNAGKLRRLKKGGLNGRGDKAVYQGKLLTRISRISAN